MTVKGVKLKSESFGFMEEKPERGADSPHPPGTDRVNVCKLTSL